MLRIVPEWRVPAYTHDRGLIHVVLAARYPPSHVADPVGYLFPARKPRRARFSIAPAAWRTVASDSGASADPYPPTRFRSKPTTTVWEYLMTLLDAAPRIQPTADVDSDAALGERTVVWHLAQIREGAMIGAGSTIGRGAYIGPHVELGRNCKIQNYALVYEPARLADGVFIGPAAVLTNDEFPRAVNPDGSLKSADDWVEVGVTVGTGASIGARAVCIAPVTVGSWATVAAGAVVTRNVPDYSIVVGVPARHVGWVGQAGHPLVADDGAWRCPVTGQLYRECESGLEPAE